MPPKDNQPKKRRISEYKPDPLNHNKGSEFGDHLLEKSIRQNGLGRSILVSADDVIIAGNKTQGKSGELGLDKVIEVETDGTELVVVKRKDIKSGTPAFYNLAMAENLVQKHNFVEDAAVTEAIVEKYDVQPYDWGAKDDRQLHNENENKGKGLKNFGIGGEDDDDEDSDPPPANTTQQPIEKAYAIAGTVNRAHLAKWEKWKQIKGFGTDSEALKHIIDNLIDPQKD